ncbi:hypothetical protein B0H13DRAFT_2353903 [Mycena leptocephala]|nr:hypothetical protein B0H13DRAFT_2353903 [Mycena leptocephala]
MSKLFSTAAVRYGAWIWAHPSPAALRAYVPIRGVIEHLNAGAWRGFARHREVKPLAPTRVPRQNAPHSSPVSDLTNPSLSPLSAPTDPRPRGCARLNTLGSAPTRPFPKSELWKGRRDVRWRGMRAEGPEGVKAKESEGVKAGADESERTILPPLPLPLVAPVLESES